MRIAQDITQLIGHIPLVQLNSQSADRTCKDRSFYDLDMDMPKPKTTYCFWIRQQKTTL